MKDSLTLKPLRKTSPKLVWGFTLIELLVAISIFTIILGASIGAILGMVDANRKAQALKSVMNNLNITLDTLSRDIVVARDLSVTDSDVADCVDSHSNTQLDMEKSGEDLSYRLNITNTEGDNCFGRIERSTNPSDSGSWQAITAPEVRIENLRFHAISNPPPGVSWSSTQPKILILVEGNAGVKENVISEFRIQTTASQRTPEFYIGN